MLEDVYTFLTGSQAPDLSGVDPEAGYDLVRRTLVSINYDWLSKRDKGLVKHALDHWLDCYRDKYSKASGCLSRNREELLVFYNFPAKH